MLADKRRMYAYPFEGYWKDVGTIDSLWESNLDLLRPNVELDLSDSKWRIYSRTRGNAPHYLGEKSEVQNSIVTEGCVIDGKVEFSVLFSEVTVEEGAEIHDSIVMPGAVIKKGAVVEYAIVGENSVVGENAKIGSCPEKMTDLEKWGIAVVGSGLEVGKNAEVKPQTMLAENLKEGECQ